MILTGGTYIWCSHVDFTCGVHMWFPSSDLLCSHVEFTYNVHMWSSRVDFIYGVHMWSSHVEFTYDLKYVPYVIYRMWFTVCGVHMWFSLKSYTDIKSYTENHMWFSVYDFRMWSPYVEFVCGVHMWFSSMIIYGPYMITYGNHMWSWLPYVESTCGIIRMWSPHVDLFSLVMGVLCVSRVPGPNLEPSYMLLYNIFQLK